MAFSFLFFFQRIWNFSLELLALLLQILTVDEKIPFFDLRPELGESSHRDAECVTVLWIFVIDNTHTHKKMPVTWSTSHSLRWYAAIQTDISPPAMKGTKGIHFNKATLRESCMQEDGPPAYKFWAKAKFHQHQLNGRQHQNYNGAELVLTRSELSDC